MPGELLVGVQADDLTGACDTGAPFAARGLHTLVLLGDGALPAPLPDVLVLDTETRGGPTSAAAAAARTAGERLAGARAITVYKKLDSTLRGHVAAELTAVLAGAGLDRALVAPAFPGQRRTILDGRLRVGGRPAASTPIAADPDFPSTGDSLPALLAGAGERPVTVVPLATVRAGAAGVAARLARLGALFACDAETAADLAALAAAAAGPRPLLAGSAGLAAALAERLAGRPRATPLPLRRPLLIVAGTAHPATAAQLARLAASGAAARILAPEGGGAGLQDPAGRRVVADRLAAAARDALAARSRPATLLLTGGETAASVCRALGATTLALQGELEPGLAVAALADGPFAGLVVVTKAGGFGDAETLARIQERCT